MTSFDQTSGEIQFQIILPSAFYKLITYIVIFIQFIVNLKMTKFNNYTIAIVFFSFVVHQLNSLEQLIEWYKIFIGF